MAHEVETTAFFGEVPWHGFGTKLTEDDSYDWPIACQKAGLDWEVALTPLVTSDDHVEVAHRAVRRSSDGRILGVVGPRFHPLQNREAFEWFQPFLDSRQASLNTAGSLRSGSRVWVLAKLNRDPLRIAPGDDVEKFLLLSHGHDGSLAVRVGFTPIRVVCANTLAASHASDASKLIRLKHSRSLKSNLENVREVMNLANEQFEATADQYRKLVRKDINQADLDKYVRRVLGADEPEASCPSQAGTDAISRLFESGKGNQLPGVRGTLWAAYNAVTEWLSYERGRSDGTRLDSLWFGEAAKLNRKALQIAVEMAC
jgi:phage/plasmid-like protein (TIGR03299 family)